MCFNVFKKCVCILFLFIVICFSCFALAEDDVPFCADIEHLMGDGVSQDSAILYFNDAGFDGVDPEKTSFVCDIINSRDELLRVVFDFDVYSVFLGDAQYSTIEGWLKAIVFSSVQKSPVDATSICNVIYEEYTNRRENAVAGETGMPIWSNNGIVLRQLSVYVPYLVDLQEGSVGDAVSRLQNRLCTLGFISEFTDGVYDENVSMGVALLQNYVRMLEYDLIDNYEQPGQQIIDDGSGMPIVIDAKLEYYEPMTEVNGVADGVLQRYLYSDDFKVSASDIIGTTSDVYSVMRVQNRLKNLGFFVGDNGVDGFYGSDTMRSVVLFQYSNGLSVTGVADLGTQNVLFSAEAKPLDKLILKKGDEGNDVLRLQERLGLLGFMSEQPDGIFGENTFNGVKRAQVYMKSVDNELFKYPVSVNGIADCLFLNTLYDFEFPVFFDDMCVSAEGMDVKRVQYRLSYLNYYYEDCDGIFGSDTEKAVKDFQLRNGLVVTGVVDTSTQQIMFNSNAKIGYKPYMIRVSVGDQRVYVYALDSNDEYTDLVKKMKCSTGKKDTPTPLGTFEKTTCPGEEWHYFKKFGCWARYAYYINGGILFHSVIYNSRGGKPTSGSVNALGHRASHGCVRLSVEDAKWIFENCPAHTKVVVEN